MKSHISSEIPEQVPEVELKNVQLDTSQIGYQVKIAGDHNTSASRQSSKMASRLYLVDFLTILFGISAWIEINGLWVELPILVSELPEKWKLASFIVVITQAANIGPIVYSLCRHFWPGKIREVPVIHGTLFIGTTSCFLLIFLWSRTTFVGGEEHSTALLTLTFFLAFVDCTTSVLYLPFMANFRDKYVISYLLGEGLSGLLPSIFALIQGASSRQGCQKRKQDYSSVTSTEVPQTLPSIRFSVEAFFAILFSLMVISWTAFFLLDKLPLLQSEKVVLKEVESPDVTTDLDSPGTSSGSSVACSSTCLLPKESISRTFFLLLLFIQAYACAMSNGVLTSIQTYSTLPYGTNVYHLAATLSVMANPLACTVAFFVTLSGIAGIGVLVTMATGCAIYILLTALESPNPPLAEHVVGKALVVIAWILFSGLISYVKACVASILRRTGGQRALFWCGVVTQVGSFVGAILMFGLVNYTKIFTPC